MIVIVDTDVDIRPPSSGFGDGKAINIQYFLHIFLKMWLASHLVLMLSSIFEQYILYDLFIVY